MLKMILTLQIGHFAKKQNVQFCFARSQTDDVGAEGIVEGRKKTSRARLVVV